jgi:hypothetical protein
MTAGNAPACVKSEADELFVSQVKFAANTVLKEVGRKGACLAVLSTVIALLPPLALAVQNVTLAWNPSPDPTVAGYRVYWGRASQLYDNVTDVGNKTVATISGLVERTTYFFAATAYDSLGMESPFSNEAVYTVPRVVVPRAVISRVATPRVALKMKRAQAGGPFNTFSIASAMGTAPSSWALQASEDLKTWHSLATGTNPSVSVAVVVSTTQAMFFRLRSASPGISLTTQKIRLNGFPDSFFITSSAPSLLQWVMEASSDLKTWKTLASETNSPVKVAVIVSAAPKMFFRLKGE